MKGLHLTADLYRCRCEPAWLTDAQKLGDWCTQAVEAVGLTVVDRLLHACPAGAPGARGVSATLLLPQSHVCLHTWPAERAVTADVYVTQERDAHATAAHGLVAALVQRFQPEWTEQRSLDRGDGV